MVPVEVIYEKSAPNHRERWCPHNQKTKQTTKETSARSGKICLGLYPCLFHFRRVSNRGWLEITISTGALNESTPNFEWNYSFDEVVIAVMSVSHSTWRGKSTNNLQKVIDKADAETDRASQRRWAAAFQRTKGCSLGFKGWLWIFEASNKT